MTEKKTAKKAAAKPKTDEAQVADDQAAATKNARKVHGTPPELEAAANLYDGGDSGQSWDELCETDPKAAQALVDKVRKSQKAGGAELHDINEPISQMEKDLVDPEK